MTYQIKKKNTLYHLLDFLFQDLLHTTLNALQLYNTNLLWREKREKKIQAWTSGGTGKSEAKFCLGFIKQKEAEAFWFWLTFPFFPFLPLSSGKLLVSLMQLSKWKKYCRSFLRGRKNKINSRGGRNKNIIMDCIQCIPEVKIITNMYILLLFIYIIT